MALLGLTNQSDSQLAQNNDLFTDPVKFDSLTQFKERYKALFAA